MSSIAMPACSIARAAASRLSTRSVTGTRTRRAWASTVTRSGKSGSSAVGEPLEVGAVVDVHLEHVAADAAP